MLKRQALGNQNAASLAVPAKKHHSIRVTDLLHHVESAICQRRLLIPGQKLLVAVSGGVDSMVLLHALHRLARQHGWKLGVAHFDHQLRGRASRADARFVQRAAATLKLRFFGGQAPVKAMAVQSKMSTEMAARKMRHEFLARIARENDVSVIALAHHADDQVEHFFLRLFRGAGGEGIAGMKWRSPSPADKNVALVRPLLDCPKFDLLAYAHEHKIRFREDATNASPDHLRNRIRNELLPLLRKKYQPGLDKTVLRLMDIIGADAELVASAAQNFCRNRRAEPQESFVRLPVAVQRKAVQQQLIDFGLIPDFELVEHLRGSPGKPASVGVGLTVACDASGKVACREQFDADFNPASIVMKLAGSRGSVRFAGRRMNWRRKLMENYCVPIKKTGRNPAVIRECFDASAVGDQIVLRHWRPGDRFQPIGLKSPAKLQDLFVNAKIPASRRRSLILATTAQNEVFWVEGLRIGEKFKLTRETGQMLEWTAGRVRP